MNKFLPVCVAVFVVLLIPIALLAIIVAVRGYAGFVAWIFKGLL